MNPIYQHRFDECIIIYWVIWTRVNITWDLWNSKVPELNKKYDTKCASCARYLKLIKMSKRINYRLIFSLTTMAYRVFISCFTAQKFSSRVDAKIGYDVLSANDNWKGHFYLLLRLTDWDSDFVLWLCLAPTKMEPSFLAEHKPWKPRSSLRNKLDAEEHLSHLRNGELSTTCDTDVFSLEFKNELNVSRGNSAVFLLDRVSDIWLPVQVSCCPCRKFVFLLG